MTDDTMLTKSIKIEFDMRFTDFRNIKCISYERLFDTYVDVYYTNERGECNIVHNFSFSHLDNLFVENFPKIDAAKFICDCISSGYLLDKYEEDTRDITNTIAVDYREFYEANKRNLDKKYPILFRS